MEEIWKDIEGYEGLYQVSNLGMVKSLSRYIKTKGGSNRLSKEKIMKISFDADGYKILSLSKFNKKSMHKLHRLLAIYFIPKIEGKDIVNHINGITDDNRIENLEWCNNRENTSHGKNKLINTSKFSGVSYHKRVKKWCTRIVINKKRIHLGVFNTEIEARDAYQAALIKYNIENRYST